MLWLEILIVYAGLTICGIGLISVIKPLPFLRIGTRRRGLAVVCAGFLLFLVGALLPVPLRHSSSAAQIDLLMPGFQFDEVHSLRVEASPERVVEAAQQVTPGEIRFLRTLLGLRTLPERLLGGTPPPLEYDRPLVEFDLGPGAVVLNNRDRDFAVGVAARLGQPDNASAARLADADGFRALAEPRYAKLAMSLKIASRKDGSCRVTTETRVLATDATVRRLFATYWRVIYPWSSLLRVTFLEALKERAEAPRLTPSLEANKTVVRGYMAELINQERWERWPEYFPPRVSFNDRELSPPDFQRVGAAFRRAFPDLQLAVDEQIAEGDWVVTLVTGRGTHVGDFAGIPGTGRRVEFWGFAMDRLQAGKVVEMRHEIDTLGVIEQLRAEP